jgi:hypothetical protein
MSGKPILAVDVDDTIAHLMTCICQFYKETYPPPHFEVSDYHTLEFNVIWGGTREEADEKVEAFYVSEHMTSGIHPIAGAREELEKLKEHFELHIVTARPHNVRQKTIDWITKHFGPDLFTDFHFGNLYGMTGVRRRKSQMCGDIGAVCLVDDSAGYALDCAGHKLPVLLFGDYAWNTNDDLKMVLAAHDQYIHRVGNWQQAGALLMKMFINKE